MVLGLLVAGCRGRKADLGMSDSAFVRIMADLKVVADAPSITPEVRAQRRDAVLRKSGVSADQLEKLNESLLSHPQQSRQLWSAIELKAQALVKPKP